MLENRMVIDSERNEIEYGVKKKRRSRWEENDGKEGFFDEAFGDSDADESPEELI